MFGHFYNIFLWRKGEWLWVPPPTCFISAPSWRNPISACWRSTPSPKVQSTRYPGTFTRKSKFPDVASRAGERARHFSSRRCSWLEIWTCQAWEGILWTSPHFRMLFPTSSMECQILTKDAIDWITMTDALIETVIEIQGETTTFDGTVVVREEDLPATGFHQK